MAKTEPFERHPDQYEEWFVQNRFVYQSEIEALRRHIPERGRGVEIGVGSGLFARPLKIYNGLEPSEKMRALAVKRGVNVVDGVAERLPFQNDFYKYVLMVTTICFLDDPAKSIVEARRILEPGGKLFIGFVDKNSSLGRQYQEHKQESLFYRQAMFYSTSEIVALMKEAGFTDFNFTQTIFKNLDQIRAMEEVRDGYGEGSFVVVSAVKAGSKNGDNSNYL